MKLDINVFGYLVILFIIGFILKIYFESDMFHLKCIVSDEDGHTYCVRETPKLELVAETNQNTINQLQEDNAKMNQLSSELQNDLAEATKYKDELINKLQKHDLTRLSLKKPGLIEKRINNGTKKLFESFESLTGNTTTE
mgnify:CR=1 FL=1